MSELKRSIAALALACPLALLVVLPLEFSIAAPSPMPDDDDDDDAGEDTYTLTGVIRDFSSHPDFGSSAMPGVKSAQNIDQQLSLDGKPMYVGHGKRVETEWRDGSPFGRVISWCAPVCSAPPDVPGAFGADDAGGIQSAESFHQWFRDVPGVNMSTLHSIQLKKYPSGAWKFETENFLPIDEQLLGNGPDPHNYDFTYEIVAQFEYNPVANQYFQVESSDDCWVFINNKLVIDLNGIDTVRKHRITFDRLGLASGQTYKLHLFMAERYQPQTSFELRTNVLMESIEAASIFAVFD